MFEGEMAPLSGVLSGVRKRVKIEGRRVEKKGGKGQREGGKCQK